jgi:hypothetical protein
LVFGESVVGFCVGIGDVLVLWFGIVVVMGLCMIADT